MSANTATGKSNQNKIVIIGRGLLGQALATALQEFKPIILTHRDLDITKQAQVDEVLGQLAPDVIINAAAYAKVDQCETERALAMQVNSVAPRYLAMAAKRQDAYFIHYSTDYVFSGKQAAGYPETANDFAPINTYGESKLGGEQAIQQVADSTWQKFYIIRTAWLYGGGGTNFVDTMIALGKQRSELKVVNDQHGSPTFTQDLAEQTRQLIEQRLAGGIYHCTNSGHCTWFEFAQAIFALNHQTVQVLPCTSAEFPRPAQRPAYSILLNTKLPAMRPWQSALADYINQRSDKV
ncbi:MAG: hypothetical protein ACD_43C00107G0008 [uncultured bacterium]|nr:MAG: hypothetical protein ACD_43C00107G0008 [uncultured bacterium]